MESSVLQGISRGMPSHFAAVASERLVANGSRELANGAVGIIRVAREKTNGFVILVTEKRGKAERAMPLAEWSRHSKLLELAEMLEGICRRLNVTVRRPRGSEEQKAILNELGIPVSS